MELSNLMVKSKSVWVDFPGLKDFEVLVAILSRKELTNLRKSCITTKFNRKTRLQEEQLNEDKFVELFTKATLKDWKGLTLAHLETLILIDTTDKDLDAELEYSQDNAELLVTNSTEFDEWLNTVIFDLNTFRTER